MGNSLPAKGTWARQKYPSAAELLLVTVLKLCFSLTGALYVTITLYVSGFSPGNLDPHLVATVKCGLALLVTDTVFIDGITLANHVLHTMGIFVGRELCSDELFSAP